MRKPKNKLCTERIYLRVTKEEKKKIKQKAQNRKTGISEIVRDAMNSCGGLESEVKNMKIAVTAEEICRYVEDKYETNDRYLRKQVKKIWELCQ